MPSRWFILAKGFGIGFVNTFSQTSKYIYKDVAEVLKYWKHHYRSKSQPIYRYRVLWILSCCPTFLVSLYLAKAAEPAGRRHDGLCWVCRSNPTTPPHWCLSAWGWFRSIFLWEVQVWKLFFKKHITKKQQQQSICCWSWLTFIQRRTSVLTHISARNWDFFLFCSPYRHQLPLGSYSGRRSDWLGCLPPGSHSDGVFCGLLRPTSPRRPGPRPESAVLVSFLRWPPPLVWCLACKKKKMQKLDWIVYNIIQRQHTVDYHPFIISILYFEFPVMIIFTELN